MDADGSVPVLFDIGVMEFPPLSAVVRKGEACASPGPDAVSPVYAPPRLLGTRFGATREEEVGVERAGRITPPPPPPPVLEGMGQDALTMALAFEDD